MSDYPLESYKFVIFDVTKDNLMPKKEYPLKEYEIWSGSFLITGMEGIAAKPIFHGTQEGRSFQDACFRYFLKSEAAQRENYDKKGEYYDTTRFDYNPYKNTYWACQLFESKEAAYEDYNKNWK